MDITLKDIQDFSKKYNDNPVNKVIENAITNNGLENTMLDRKMIAENPPVFNIELPARVNKYDQKNSALCWIYAGINMIQFDVVQNLNMDVENLTLSPVYISFFDRLEKASAIYEKIIRLEDASYEYINENRIIVNAPYTLGFFEFFRGLINKYGFVPDSVMPETKESINNNRANTIYCEKMMGDIVKLIKLKEENASMEALEKQIKIFLEENYMLLSKMLGEPVRKFTYEYIDKDGNFQRLENITPLEFKKQFLKIDLNEFISIANMPRHNKEYGKVYRYTGNSSIEEYTFLNLASINYDALLIGVLTLAIVFGVPKRINKIFPSTVLALIVCTFISMKLGLNVDKISAVSVDWPKIVFPHASVHDIITYFHYAITLAIILTAESLLTGLVCDSLTKTTSSPKRIILAQGVGNAVCALTGSLAGAAATMRTVAALKAGATTRMAAFITPVVLLLLLFQFSGFVAEIPLAVLAGILIKIGYDIIDVKLLKVIKFAPKEDLYVLLLVFLLTVFYNLIVAVGAGITLAALLYAKRVADKARIVHKVVHKKEVLTLEKSVEEDFHHKIRIAHIDGQFFFGSVTQLISKFDVMLGTKILILTYDSGDLLDISAIFALEDIIERLRSQHIRILLVVPDEAVLNQLREHKILEQIGQRHVFTDEMPAIDFAKKALKKMGE